MKAKSVHRAWLALWIGLVLTFERGACGYGQSASPPPETAASAPGFGEAAQEGSTASTPAAACCPPAPGQEPPAQSPQRQSSGGPRYGPDGNIIPEYSSGQGPEDDARGLKYKRPLFGKGRARAPSGTSASASASQIQAYPPPGALPEDLDPVNQRVVAELQKELQNGAQTRELCFDSVLRLYGLAGAPIDPEIQAVNTKAYDHRQSPLTPEERSIAAAITEGELDRIEPSLKLVGSDALQSGDICLLPAYYEVVKHDNGKTKQVNPVDGHVGIVLFNAKKNRWEFVSTNNVDSSHTVQPGWLVLPLDDVSYYYYRRSGQLPEFFHWIGPEASAAGP